MGNVIEFRTRRASLWNDETMAKLRSGHLRESPRLTRAFQGIGDNTAKTYRWALRGFDKWAHGLPVTDEVLANFLTHLQEKDRTHGYLRVCRAAVRFREHALDRPDPSGSETRLAMGISRRRRRKTKQARHLTLAEIQGIVKTAADTGSLWGVRDAALISIMFACGLRAGEAANMEVRDLEVLEDGGGLLTIQYSKTDQEGKGAVVGLPPGPVRHLQEWIKMAKLNQGDPLFTPIKGCGPGFSLPVIVRRKMLTQYVAKIVQKRAAAAGHEGISSHSLRRSFALHLSLQGKRTHEIQEAGRWVSPAMVLTYTRGSRAVRSKIAQAIGWE